MAPIQTTFMPNLFKTIRKQLAADNKPMRYFRYAFGEIILVVIGILIAVGINNWNKERLLNIKADSLIKRLYTETSKNVHSLDVQIALITKSHSEVLTLLGLFGPDYHTLDERYVDSLLYSIILTPIYDYSTATLDEALNTGLVSIIRSDSLRALLYTVHQKIDEIKDYELEMTNNIESVVLPYLHNEISLFQIDMRFNTSTLSHLENKLNEVDNRAILTKRQFQNMVDESFFTIETLILGYEGLEQTLKLTLDNLRTEIKE